MVDEAQSAVDHALRHVWAKSWPLGQPPDEWCSLDRHLTDAADVAGLLWDEWVAGSTRGLISREVGGQDQARRLLRFLAGVHDVGKASPAFAVQVDVLSDRMRRVGLRAGPTVVNDRSALRHEAAGAAALERWLTARTPAGQRVRRALSVVIAGHHGAYPSWTVVQGPPVHLLGAGLWAEVQDALINRAAERSEVDWDDIARRSLSVAAQSALTGLVIVADWIASDDFCFPLVPVEHVPLLDRPQATPSERAQRGWRLAGLPARWRAPAVLSSVDDLFAARFPDVGAPPRPVQRAVVEAARTMPVPGLLLVEAPMGSGKTEAALLAAETLAARSGASGIFVALPTQATSSAMLTRAQRYLRRVLADDAQRHTLALVHGKAALNEELAALPSIRARTVLDDEPAEHEQAARYLMPVAEVWGRGRKRAALAQFVVATIDQVLFAALLARHFVVRQLSLTGKVVVIDEVHAADSYMAVYLDRALEWLGASGAPVVLLSATLPAARRGELVEAYERGRRKFVALDDDGVDMPTIEGEGYPTIVVTGEGGPCVTSVGPSASTASVRVERLDDGIGALVQLLRDKLRDGGCAAVVRNTVARAQATADALEAEFGRDVVFVAHSRFLDADRRANDVTLLSELGPAGDRPDRRIVVGTQVLEQSLDIDADLMVTDLAPVDLVLQRIGRLHRHARSTRPPAVAAPRCYVTGVEWSRDVPAPDAGSVAVYGAYPLLAALDVLTPHLDGRLLQLPADIALLVQEAYRPGRESPAGWEDEWAAAVRAERRERALRRKRAEAFLLDPPHGRDLYGASRGGAGNVDEDSPQGRACVRDSGESIEVVVVVRGADGVDRVPPWVAAGVDLPLRHVPPDDDVARILAGCTVRLPPSMVREWSVGERVIADLERQHFEGWDQTPLLKQQLALVLDENHRASVAQFDLHYDRRRGLTATKRAP